MKIKILLVATILMFGFVTMQAQNSIFDRLSDHKEISTVYISKALLGMMPNMNMNGANVKGLANKLEQMEIYNSESKEATNLIRNEMNKLIKNKTHEVLMAIKDKGENVTFYARKDKDKFKELIMYVNSPDECTLIRIVGTFTPEDVQSVMSGSKKK